MYRKFNRHLDIENKPFFYVFWNNLAIQIFLFFLLKYIEYKVPFKTRKSICDCIVLYFVSQKNVYKEKKNNLLT